MSDNIIARLRRAASKVMPEDHVRVRMTAHEADFLADSADGYRAFISHLERRPLRGDYDTDMEHWIEMDIWEDVLKDWSHE